MEFVEVKIPKTLYNRISIIAEKMGFEDPSTLVVHLLREAVAKVEEELSYTEVSEEEKKEIIERLKSLGYL